MDVTLLVSGILSHKKESLAITTINFAKELTRSGHKVTIVTRNKFKEADYEVKENVAYLRTKNIKKFPLGKFPLRFSLYNKLLSYPLAIRKLKKKLSKADENKFQIIHGFSASPILILRSLLSKWFCCRSAKIVHTLKSYPIKKDIKAKKGSRLLSRMGDISYKLLNFADIVTVPTHIYANKLISKGVQKHKIKIIRSHIDLNKFSPKTKQNEKSEKPEKLELKARYGYKDKKIILNYGAMWEIKGTDYLIKSMPEVIEKNPDVLVLLAPRNKEQALEKYLPMIKEMKIEKNVQFILKDVKIEDYVSLADVVVIPYPHLEGTEGNPSCLLESLACGTPIITTNLPELAEVFSDCAILVEPRNVERLSEAVNYVLNDDNSQVMESKIEAGLHRVQEFDSSRIAGEFIKVYLLLR